MSILHIIILFVSWLITWFFAYNGTVLHNFLLIGSFIYLILFCKEYNKQVKARKKVESNINEIKEVEQLERELEQDYEQENDPGKLFKLKEDLKMLREYRLDLRVENERTNRRINNL